MAIFFAEQLFIKIVSMCVVDSTAFLSLCHTCLTVILNKLQLELVKTDILFINHLHLCIKNAMAYQLIYGGRVCINIYIII